MIAADHGSFTQGELAFDTGAQPLSAERRFGAVDFRVFPARFRAQID
jgi:hypothetical protein